MVGTFFFFWGGGEVGGGGGGGAAPPPPPLEFAKLNIADITGNEKISYFSYLCTSTFIRQTESIACVYMYVCVWGGGGSYLRFDPPGKKFLDPRLCTGILTGGKGVGVV